MAFCNSALNLLSAYNSSGDESDEDIPGPRVSVKRSLSRSETTDGSCKKVAGNERPRLPLPSALVSSCKPEGDAAKDSTRNQNGRIRSFPHERGNWASYVYIAIDPSSSLLSFMDVLCAMCDPSLKLEKSSDLHISLTRTIILKHHWIEPIASSVQKMAQSFSRFRVCLGAVKVYTNEEQTRTFLGIVVTAGSEMLKEIAKELDKILEDFKLPPFYKEASFHLSIASCVGNHAGALSSHLSRFQTNLDMFIHSNPLEWSINIEALHFRTGNKYFAFNMLS